MSIRRWDILCLIGLFFLSGCVPESDNPISDPRTAQWDQGLTGTWAGRVRDSGAAVWLHIAPDRDSPADVSMILTEEGKGMELFFYRMHPSSVGPYRFMNLKPDIPRTLECRKEQSGSGTQEAATYLVAKYEITPEGTLKVWLMTRELARYVETGQIRGEVKRDKYTTETRITDTGENLAKFLKDTDHGSIFELFLEGRRVPWTPPEPSHLPKP